ncbi:MAG: SEL1-like repeat protein [Wenzhouxiangella sp.]
MTVSWRSGIAAAVLGLGLGLGSAVQASGFFSYAEHTPSYRTMNEATRFYNNGDYLSARARFRSAARWADKTAQFNLAVTYYKGQGTESDVAKAWAWFQLAAERGYPMMVDMADMLDGMINDDLRRRGQAILDELKPIYGDEVAVERTAAHMRRERRRATGSRVGATGFVRVVDSQGFSRDGRDFFRREAWDFEQVIAREAQLFDALDRGVRVRDIDTDEKGSD